MGFMAIDSPIAPFVGGSGRVGLLPVVFSSYRREMAVLRISFVRRIAPSAESCRYRR
jgi:hypothetical protein